MRIMIHIFINRNQLRILRIKNSNKEVTIMITVKTMELAIMIMVKTIIKRRKN